MAAMKEGQVQQLSREVEERFQAGVSVENFEKAFRADNSLGKARDRMKVLRDQFKSFGMKQEQEMEFYNRESRGLNSNEASFEDGVDKAVQLFQQMDANSDLEGRR